MTGEVSAAAIAEVILREAPDLAALQVPRTRVSQGQGPSRATRPGVLMEDPYFGPTLCNLYYSSNLFQHQRSNARDLASARRPATGGATRIQFSSVPQEVDQGAARTGGVDFIAELARLTGMRACGAREIGGSGGALEPSGRLLTHLHTFYRSILSAFLPS